MKSFLSHFDADDYVQTIKDENYEKGYDLGTKEGYDLGSNEGKTNTIISLYIKNKITLLDALEESGMQEQEFNENVAKYKEKLELTDNELEDVGGGGFPYIRKPTKRPPAL